jgi:hypothetical protein
MSQCLSMDCTRQPETYFAICIHMVRKDGGQARELLREAGVLRSTQRTGERKCLGWFLN